MIIDTSSFRLAPASRRPRSRIRAASIAALMLAAAPFVACAQASGDTVTFSNPATIASPFGYTHVVEVNPPYRIAYISGQLGLDLEGRLVGEPGDFRAQAQQTFVNLGHALESLGATFDDVVKVNIYLTDARNQLPILREIRDSHINTAAPPASTAVQIAGLAIPGALLEIEAIVALPPKP